MKARKVEDEKETRKEEEKGEKDIKIYHNEARQHQLTRSTVHFNFFCSSSPRYSARCTHAHTGPNDGPPLLIPIASSLSQLAGPPIDTLSSLDPWTVAGGVTNDACAELNAGPELDPCSVVVVVAIEVNVDG